MSPIKGLNKLSVVFGSVTALALLVSCAPGGDPEYPREINLHKELMLVDPSNSGMSVSAQAINIGSIYLETQQAPLKVNGVSLQASDVSIAGANAYVAYSSYDTGGVASKVGAVERMKPVNCDNVFTLLRVEYCLTSAQSLSFPTADIFSTFSDGTSLYAVGSTLSEDQFPYFGRLFKISMDSSLNPLAITMTKTLQSYAGTSVIKQGTSLYVTSGTSVDSTKMGGLSILNASTLATIKDHSLYDARAAYISSSDTSKVYVARGKVDNSNLGAVLEYNANGTGSALRTIATGGNTIAESKSNVVVGNELILASMGDQGFRVMCKATGLPLATQAAVTVSGIAAAKTVTNSVIAVPGYIFAANGEAGVYVYKFSKSSAFNSNYCDGVTLSFLGRLSLANDGSLTSYVNGELSANSLTYVPIVSGLITTKLIVVASGNKGVSLINISGINLLPSLDVDDF